MRINHVNILHANDTQWEQYFDFYKKINSPSHKFNNFEDFKSAKINQTITRQVKNFIFLGENKCNAVLFLFNEDVKNKTLDIKINMPPESDDALIISIVEFIRNELKRKPGYSFIGTAAAPVVYKISSAANAEETNDYHITRLYTENVNYDLFSDRLEKSKTDFKEYSVNKFINLPESMLASYVTFVNNFRHDFISISEGAKILLSLDDLRVQREQCKNENRERITYVIYTKNREMIAAINLEARNGIIFTALTAVKKDLRGKGIAKFLKIYSIMDILKSNPEFEYIQTRTNFKNTPMFSLNAQLGFQIVDTTHEFILR